MNVKCAPIPYNAQMVEDIFPVAAHCKKKHGHQAVFLIYLFITFFSELGVPTDYIFRSQFNQYFLTF